MRYESWKRLIFMGQVRSYEIRNADKITNVMLRAKARMALFRLFSPFAPSPLFLFSFFKKPIIFAFNFKFVFAHDYR